MPSYYKRKLIKIGGSEYIAIPKAWLDAKRKQGIFKPSYTDKDKVVWHLELITNNSITIKIPQEADISFVH